MNSFPLLMPVKLAAGANITDTMKSFACVVVTAGPGVLLEMNPLEILVASGDTVEVPDTSQVVNPT